MLTLRCLRVNHPVKRLAESHVVLQPAHTLLEFQRSSCRCEHE